MIGLDLCLDTKCCNRLTVKLPRKYPRLQHIAGRFEYSQKINYQPAYHHTDDKSLHLYYVHGKRNNDRWVIAWTVKNGQSEVYGNAWNEEKSQCPEKLSRQWLTAESSIIEGLEIQCFSKILNHYNYLDQG